MHARSIFGIVLSTFLIAVVSDGMEADRLKGALPDNVIEDHEIIYLNSVKGWTEKDRHRFYHTPQGTRIIPYYWFLNLDQIDSTADKVKLFRDEGNLKRYRFIPDHTNHPDNPDGIPVGFARNYNPLDRETYLGFSCAACHTSQINYTNKDSNKRYTIYIDGGSSMADHLTFTKEMYGSLNDTLGKNDKFIRFAKAVLKDQYNEDTQMEFQDTVKDFLDQYVARPNTAAKQKGINELFSIQWGFSRNDALGRGGNTFLMKLNPANVERVEAPVSIPYVWAASKYDYVQWNGSIHQPMGRNIGQAIGLNADVKLELKEGEKQDDLFKSSIDVNNIY